MVLKFKLEWNELTSANRQNSHNLRNLHKKKNARLISTIQLFVTIFQMSYKLDKNDKIVGLYKKVSLLDA